MLSFSVGRVLGLALALGMVPASAIADPAPARMAPDAALVRVAAVDSAAPATLPGSSLDPMPTVDHPGLTAGPQPPASEPSALPETGPQGDTTPPEASQTPSAPEGQTTPAKPDPAAPSSGAAEAPSDKASPSETQPPAVTPPATEAPPAATPAPGAPAPDASDPNMSAPDSSAPGSSAPDSSAPASPAPASPSSVSPSPATPDATQPSPAPDAAPQDPGGETDTPQAPPSPPTDSGADNGPLPEIHYGVEGLPEPVRKMRQAIIDAARTGDIEKLRPVFAMSKTPPELSKEPYKDPITYLKETSGDENGREILAILLDLLDAGWVHDGAGTPDEVYVWPYFSEIPVDRLTPPQEVELLRVLTASDVDEMRAYAAYLFYKIGIAPDGTWRFFMIADDGN